MGNYLYNPCAPCCLTCGWGPFQFTSSSDNPFNNQFQETDSSGSPTWSIAGNRLTLANGSGTLWKSSPYPDPTGKAKQGHLWTSGSATIQAVCWKATSTLQSGIFIGDGRVFYADWSLGQFFRASCDVHGVVNGPLTQIPGTSSDGNTLTLCIQRMPSDNFNVSYSINGNVTATETGVALSGLTSGATFNSGFWGTQAAQFGTSSVVCGTSCPTTTSCNVCPGGLAPCWSLNASGISATEFNGSFCLRAAGCTLADSQGLWTVSIGASSSTLTAATGSSTFATYTQSGSFACNGSNAFIFVSATAGTGWPTTITIAPTNCSQVPCVAPGCGSISWPTQWSLTLSGIVDTPGGCPSGGLPAPGGGTFPTCGVFNGTFVLSLSGSANWYYQNNGPSGSLILCCEPVNVGGFDTSFNQPQFSLSCSDSGTGGGGLTLRIPLPYDCAAVTQGASGLMSSYVYFAPFSQVQPLSSVTMSLISSPPEIGSGPCCQGFPGTITVTPA